MFKQVIQILPVLIQTELIPCRVMPVDNYLNQDWNYNEAGWLRNDISALAAAQTKEQYELIARRLKELPAVSLIPAGTKVEEAFNMIRPRFCQTENEFVEFAGYMTEQGMRNIESAYQNVVKRDEKPAVDKPAVSSE